MQNNGSPLLAWQRVVFHNTDARTLSPLKENGENCKVQRRDFGSWSMDEVAEYNDEFDKQSRLIMQGAKVTGEFRTRRHLNMAMVYQVQSNKENWSRWPDLLDFYANVQAKSFFNVVQSMEENLAIEPQVSFTIYKTFTIIEFSKFQNFYSESEWNVLVYRIHKTHMYYMKNKEGISKHRYSKHYVLKKQSLSYFE